MPRHAVTSRSLNPSGGLHTLNRLAKLRVERARLEAQFAAHPKRTTAIALAAIYEQLRDEVLGAIGLELEEGE